MAVDPATELRDVLHLLMLLQQAVSRVGDERYVVHALDAASQVTTCLMEAAFRAECAPAPGDAVLCQTVVPVEADDALALAHDLLRRVTRRALALVEVWHDADMDRELFGRLNRAHAGLSALEASRRELSLR
jgi:hypothetical protein